MLLCLIPGGVSIYSAGQTKSWESNSPQSAQPESRMPSPSLTVKLAAQQGDPRSTTVPCERRPGSPAPALLGCLWAAANGDCNEKHNFHSKPSIQSHFFWQHAKRFLDHFIVSSLLYLKQMKLHPRIILAQGGTLLCCKAPLIGDGCSSPLHIKHSLLKDKLHICKKR